MVDKKLLLGAIIVVAIILVASVIYIVYKPEPQPSISEQMALTSDDLGVGWTTHTDSVPYDDDVSETWLLNDTYSAGVWLVVYDSISECEQWYENYTGLSFQNITLLNLTLGDEAFLAYYGTADEPYVDLVFIRDNTWCHILASPAIYKGKPWWINTTIWIAQLQLEKIDQYLAQHPGVN
jgi:hypothetical protein